MAFSRGDEVTGLIPFSEELAQNPLRTVHCLSFNRAEIEIQLPQNQSSME